MEWKHYTKNEKDCSSNNLGNFLSGMETSSGKRFSPSPCALGNFLSGMETAVASNGFPVAVALGNFLSGMETRGRGHRHQPGGLLGNFLSGMETFTQREIRPPFQALETSLVEWKQNLE